MNANAIAARLVLKYGRTDALARVNAKKETYTVNTYVLHPDRFVRWAVIRTAVTKVPLGPDSTMSLEKLEYLPPVTRILSIARFFNGFNPLHTRRLTIANL